MVFEGFLPYLSLIQENSTHMSEKSTWFHDMLLALYFLDENNIIHNDVTLGNIFKVDGSSDRVSLGGFYAAEKIYPTETRTSVSTRGTVEYFSPDRALAYLNKSDMYRHDSHADLYALGVAAYYYCFNLYPFEESKNKFYEDSSTSEYKRRVSAVIIQAKSNIWHRINKNLKENSTCTFYKNRGSEKYHIPQDRIE
eukprot:GHVR01068589.1.p1 GENE.GHVR01068589.1~~GHVR01068589.1.p1  ORF type:complete len:196 (+),score=22.50 GHVR01068589.1:366-953(+)